MKKRTYRAKGIKGFDVATLQDAVAGQRVAFGIDVAKEVCFGRLVRSDDQVLATVKWNQLTETRVLVEWLREVEVLAGAGNVEPVMEPSGSYGDALRYQLQMAGFRVYRVSSKRTHDAQEVFDGVPSTHDPKAADIIARLHLLQLSSWWTEEDGDQRALAAAVEQMEVHDHAYYRFLNRIEAMLARHWPELTAELELTTATLLAVLVEFGGPEGVREQPQQARMVMRKVGGYWLSGEKIKRVLSSAQTTIGVPMVEEEIRALSELASEARRHRKLAQTAERQTKKLSRRHVEVKRMAAVVGPTTAAVLLVKMNDPRGYPAAASYVKAMGLNLKVRSSGKHKGKLKITKRGPSDVRRYLYLATLRLIQRSGDPVVRAWYLRKVQRDGGVKLKAVVAVMRKLAAALWHVVRGAPFDSRLLFDTRRLRFTAKAA